MLNTIIKALCYTAILFCAGGSIYNTLTVGMLLVITGLFDFKAGYDYAKEEVKVGN